MLLKNKQTGEIAEFIVHKRIEDSEEGNQVYAPFVIDPEEWEDAPEEPSEIYFISNNGQIHEEDGHDRYREKRKEIGNYFSSREEAELAVRKLKAWKRLKDKGFKFYDWKDEPTYRVTFEWEENIKVQEIQDDLDLLFCPEENS